MNSKAVKYVVSFLIIIITITIYWQVKDHDFINFDDDVYVTENIHVRNGLTIQGLIWAFSSPHGGNWHPLTSISHMLDCHLFGLEPGSHHLINVLFHVLNTILLLYVLNLMTGEFWKSAFVAALFALHPLHVESVAWISERKDVLSTFFWMLTLWAYVKYARSLTIGSYLLVLLLFIMGLLSKPMVVTLPFVLILVDFWPLGRMEIPFIKESHDKASNESHVVHSNIARVSLLRSFIEKIPMFILSAAVSVITYMIQVYAYFVSPLDKIPLMIRVDNALISYAEYLQKMFIPTKLSVIYPYIMTNISTWYALIAACILLIISFLSVQLFQKKPYFFTGWFWYLGTLVPVIGIVQVGSQAMADRYTYIPLIGLFIIVTWGVSDLIKKLHLKRIVVIVTSAAIILTISVLSWHQITYWKDSMTLFQHAIDVTDNNPAAHFLIGTVLHEKGQLDEAIEHYQYILQIFPHDPGAHTNIGRIYYAKGKISEAIVHYQIVLEVQPDNVKVINNLGVAFAEQGSYSQAIKEFNKAIQIDPHYQPARNNLKSILSLKAESANRN